MLSFPNICKSNEKLETKAHFAAYLIFTIFWLRTTSGVLICKV